MEHKIIAQYIPYKKDYVSTKVRNSNGFSLHVKVLLKLESSDAILAFASKNLDTLIAIDLSIIFHRIAKMQNYSNQNNIFIEKKANILRLLTNKLFLFYKDLNSQGLANLAWAFAKLDIVNLPLFTTISEQAITKTNEFKPQETSNLAWAYAKLDIVNLPLFKTIAQQAMTNIKHLNPQDLANIAWAFAKLDIVNYPLFEIITQQAIPNIEDFKPQEISSLAWAFAKLDIVNLPLFEIIPQKIIAKIETLKPQEISNIAWAFAKLDIVNYSLFEIIAQQAIPNIEDFKPQEISNIAWAFAKLDIVNYSLFEIIARQAITKIKEFNPLGLANLVWAFAINENHNFDFIYTLLEQLDNILIDLDPAIENQIFDSIRYLQYFDGKDNSKIPSSLLDRLIIYDIEQAKGLRDSSRIHLKVADTLIKLGFEVENEYYDHGRFIDSAVITTEGLYAIEIDGPSHFDIKDNHMLGHTKFRNRLLQAIGWKVIDLHYKDISNNFDNLEEYLKEYLKEKII